jgi:hypothetical protein
VGDWVDKADGVGECDAVGAFEGVQPAASSTSKMENARALNIPLLR